MTRAIYISFHDTNATVDPPYAGARLMSPESIPKFFSRSRALQCDREESRTVESYWGNDLDVCPTPNETDEAKSVSFEQSHDRGFLDTYIDSKGFEI